MITLALDAATYAGTVAVFDRGRMVSEASIAMKGADRERLMPAVAEALAAARVPVDRIGRVVCGEGPERSGARAARAPIVLRCAGVHRTRTSISVSMTSSAQRRL